MSACVQCFILLVSDSITCLGNSLHIQPIRLFSSAKKLVKMLRTCARVRICWPGFSALWQTHKIFRSCLSHPHERTIYVLLECVYAHMVSCTRPQTTCRNIRASSLDFHPWRISHCLAQGWCDPWRCFFMLFSTDLDLVASELSLFLWEHLKVSACHKAFAAKDHG